MRFEGNRGSRVDIEAAGVGSVIVSVTAAQGDRAPDVAVAILDVNHAEALAAGIMAAAKELHARAVSP